MTLKNFINELEKISKNIDNSKQVKVQMADCLDVVKPIFKNGVVYITDINPDTDNS